MKISISTAGRTCAWRAVYIYLGSRRFGGGRRIACFGIDPNHLTLKPEFFFGVGRRNYHLPIPTMRWQHPMSRRRLALYKVQQRLLSRLDTRYRR